MNLHTITRLGLLTFMALTSTNIFCAQLANTIEQKKAQEAPHLTMLRTALIDDLGAPKALAQLCCQYANFKFDYRPFLLCGIQKNMLIKDCIYKDCIHPIYSTLCKHVHLLADGTEVLLVVIDKRNGEMAVYNPRTCNPDTGCPLLWKTTIDRYEAFYYIRGKLSNYHHIWNAQTGELLKTVPQFNISTDGTKTKQYPSRRCVVYDINLEKELDCDPETVTWYRPTKHRKVNRISLLPKNVLEFVLNGNEAMRFVSERRKNYSRTKNYVFSKNGDIYFYLQNKSEIQVFRIDTKQLHSLVSLGDEYLDQLRQLIADMANYNINIKALTPEQRAILKKLREFNATMHDNLVTHFGIK